MHEVRLRKILQSDNKPMATIIRKALEEFNAGHPGTVYDDPTTDDLFAIFKNPTSTYFILTVQGEIVGGAGIYPTEGLPADTCELVKLYFDKRIRGKGYGKLMINRCEQAAREMGFTKIYLESMPELKQALPLYEKMGYTFIPYSMGNSGHSGCSLFMMKSLD